MWVFLHSVFTKHILCPITIILIFDNTRCAVASKEILQLFPPLTHRFISLKLILMDPLQMVDPDFRTDSHFLNALM